MWTTVPQRISLVQATTEEQIGNDIIVTLTSPEERLQSPTLCLSPQTSDYDTSEYTTTAGEMSSDSSDWDSLSDDMENLSIGHYGHSRSLSLASSYLPRNHKKQNPNSLIDSLASFSSLPNLTEQERDNVKDNESISTNNNMYYSDTLFYPYPNLQSLLFSQYYPYTANDYKIIDTNNNSDDDSDELKNDEIIMDWYDTGCVTKFKGLFSQLLITASFGIREDEIYLMFSSPTPQSIIQHLRFGVLSDLCNINMDRFGRRSFYYNYNPSYTRLKPRPSHFYNHSKLPSELDNLVINDAHLVSFIEETPSPITINLDDIGNNSNGVINNKNTNNNNYSFSPIVQNLFDNTQNNHTNNPINSEIITEPSSPIHNEWSPIPMARPIKITNALTKKNNDNFFPKLKANLSNHSSNHSNNNGYSNSINPNPFANINYTNTYLYTKTKTKTIEYNSHTPNIAVQNTFPKIDTAIKPKFQRKFSKKKSPNRRLPTIPKPKISERVKQKLKQRKNKKLHRKYNHNGMITVNEFKSISLIDILNGLNTNNNYLIGKKIAHYFDNIFNDTDTVVICSGTNKEPSVSYWLKGHGQYIRRSTNIGIYNKTITIYRACQHLPPKKPIVTGTQFQNFVKDICEKNKNKSVGYIGDILDKTFGIGVHFARSTLKRCDYDIFSRFSNKYECAFKMSSGAYIIAWRR